MGVTFTSAAERDRQSTGVQASRFRLADLLLALTSGVAILAIGLAYLGRLTVLELSESRRRDAVVNLNTVADARQLESALGAVFTNVYDRSLASQELFRF